MADVKVWSLKDPHPEHLPTVERMTVQTRFLSEGAVFATRMECSCGWQPEVPHGKVSDKAPSKGGRSAASHAYLRHLTAVLSTP